MHQSAEQRRADEIGLEVCVCNSAIAAPCGVEGECCYLVVAASDIICVLCVPRWQALLSLRELCYSEPDLSEHVVGQNENLAIIFDLMRRPLVRARVLGIRSCMHALVCSSCSAIAALNDSSSMRR